METLAPQKLRLILTGATGMVGEGVLHEALQNDAVEKVLIINRRPSGITHKKLTEVIHSDFFHLAPISNVLTGYDTCFFCLGVSSIGMKEDEFYTKTYVLTMHAATLLSQLNPGMTFCYISGAGTDSSEKGRLMWARVKGKTENDLMQLPFKKVYNFRPSVLSPTKGLKNTLKYYRYLGWLLPVIRWIAPNQICTLQQLGSAMIHVVAKGYPKNILEVKDIKAASNL